jgi:hypothetical protein
MAVTGLEIGQKCLNAVNMIDDLLKQQDDDDEFGFDHLDNFSGTTLKKEVSYTVGPDGSRMSVFNEEEMRRIKERVEAEKQHSLK